MDFLEKSFLPKDVRIRNSLIPNTNDIKRSKTAPKSFNSLFIFQLVANV